MEVKTRRLPSGDTEGSASPAVLAVSLRSFSFFKSASDKAGWLLTKGAKDSTAWRLSGSQLARGTKEKSIVANRRRGWPRLDGKGSSQICGATPLAISRSDEPSGEKWRLVPAPSRG